MKSLITGIYSYNIQSNYKILTPKKMLIVLTYQCNSRCIMCNIWKMKPKNELSEQEWYRLLQDPIFQNIEKINITGGEALLSPHCISLLSLFIKSMPKLYYVDIVSNGFATELIKKKVKTIATLLKKQNISFSISISLDGIDKKHMEIRRIPDAFEKTSHTIFELQKLQKTYDFSLNVGSVIMKQTVSQIAKLQTWAKNTNIPLYFQLVAFHNSYVHNLENENKIAFTKIQKFPLLKLLRQLGSPNNWKNLDAYYWKDMYFMYNNGTPRSTPCPFMYDEFAIDALGDVYYCLSEKAIGNLRKNPSVSQIYFDPKNIQYREYIKKYKCLTCNSVCNVHKAIAYDAKKYFWFLIIGIPWYGLKFHIQQIKLHLHKLKL